MWVDRWRAGVPLASDSSSVRRRARDRHARPRHRRSLPRGCRWTRPPHMSACAVARWIAPEAGGRCALFDSGDALARRASWWAAPSRQGRVPYARAVRGKAARRPESPAEFRAGCSGSPFPSRRVLSRGSAAGPPLACTSGRGPNRPFTYGVRAQFVASHPWIRPSRGWVPTGALLSRGWAVELAPLSSATSAG